MTEQDISELTQMLEGMARTNRHEISQPYPIQNKSAQARVAGRQQERMLNAAKFERWAHELKQLNIPK